MVAGTLGIVAVGVTLSAMTRSMRGGDVLFRILLFPLLIPLFYAAVNATDLIFKGGQAAGARPHPPTRSIIA